MITLTTRDTGRICKAGIGTCINKGGAEIFKQGPLKKGDRRFRVISTPVPNEVRERKEKSLSDRLVRGHVPPFNFVSRDKPGTQSSRDLSKIPAGYEISVSGSHVETFPGFIQGTRTDPFGLPVHVPYGSDRSFLQSPG